jgi:3-hydroxy acid dehydrogenase/malonic semialdehyde reductase
MLESSKSIVMVTGTPSGIGADLCRALIKRGNLVVGCARSYDKLLILKEELGDHFMPLKCDVSKKSDIKENALFLKKKKLYLQFLS